MEIVKRALMPSTHSVVVDGREHNLGIVKDFRRDPRLDRFLPRDCEASMSWVHLDPGEVLEIHTHPVPSLILVCQGQGRVIGDIEGELEEGDAVLVWPGDRHGFIGTGQGGWGLSIQFEPRTLYEDLSDPWVAFEGLNLGAGSEPLQAFLALNEAHIKTFLTHRLFSYARMGRFDPPHARRKLLDGLQVWSTHFQKAVQARVVGSHAPRYIALAVRHRDEELGHDELLRKHRVDAGSLWDPYLEATASWFTWKMLTLGDLERLVLMHLVIEAAGDIGFKKMQPYLGSPETVPYISAHLRDDGSHVTMAVDLLRHTPVVDWDALADLLGQGWSMLSALLGRISDMAVHCSSAEHNIG